MDFAKFKEELCKCDTGRSESSICTYCYNLAWLSKRIEGFTDSEHPDFTTIMDYLTENKIPARRRQSSLVAMKVLCNARGDKDGSEKYARPLVEVKNELQADYEKQQRSEKQQKNWVDCCDLKKAAKELRTATFALDKHALWDKETYARAQLAFILTFHLKYPLRRVLCTVYYKPADSSQGNVLDDKTKKIIIREHKMQRKYKDPFEFQLDRNMWRLVQLLRRQHKLRGVTGNSPILLSRYWKPLTRNSYCHWLKREMSKIECCKGKSVGCLAIRHSVITHRRRNDTTLEARKAFAYNCMHQVSMNELYRVH